MSPLRPAHGATADRFRDGRPAPRARRREVVTTTTLPEHRIATPSVFDRGVPQYDVTGRDYQRVVPAHRSLRAARRPERPRDVVAGSGAGGRVHEPRGEADLRVLRGDLARRRGGRRGRRRVGRLLECVSKHESALSPRSAKPSSSL